jgi:hypothetical protein
MARRTFFSFHYKPDVWRAQNVRNCWVVKPTEQVPNGFFDASVFEKAKKESDEGLKKFLREGLENTSVTCVLAGSETYKRRWVRYEIARSLIKQNGLLTVYIHNIKNTDGITSTKGKNPLDYIGIYRSNNSIYLAELIGDKWQKYSDYTKAIPESDLWFSPPTDNNVVRLSKHCYSYDFVNDKGRDDIAVWIENAAKNVGR